MKIAFLTDTYMHMPGTGAVPDPFRQGVLDGLERLGHDVTLFLTNRDYLRDRSMDPLEPGARERLARDIAALRPDLILTVNRAGLCPEVLELKGPKFASWYIDNVHSFPPEMLQFGDTELVFFFGHRSVIEPEGAPASLPQSRRFFLPLGMDARVFRPRPEVARLTPKRFNILFMGGFFSSAILWRMAHGKTPAFSERLADLYLAMPEIRTYPEFERHLETLGLPLSEEDCRGLLRGLQASWTGLERTRKLEAIMPLGLTIYGSNWEAMIPEHLELLRCFSGCSISDGEVLSQLFALSRMTVNITHFQSRLCGGLNLRVFEALSTGTLLVNDHPEEVGRLFEEGVEFLGYRTEAELREKCEWALAEPEQARKIADAGRQALVSGHTLQHRLVELLHVIEES